MGNFNPEELKELFDSSLGQSMWNYLNSSDGKSRMLRATELGQPAEDAINEVIYDEFGAPLDDDEVYTLISHMVNYIMVEMGYTLIERIQRSYHHKMISSCRYRMTKYRPTVMDILGVGRTQIHKPYKTWLEKKDTNRAIFDMFFNPYVIFEITGKAVFEDFDRVEGDPEISRNMLEPGSPYTIISDLSTDEIYLRIKIFYTQVLDRCLGKSAEEQEVILFGKNNHFSMTPGLIEASEEYIRRMTLYPTDSTLQDLAEKILSGILEYAFHAKDEYGVKMNQYARALKIRFQG